MSKLRSKQTEQSVHQLAVADIQTVIARAGTLIDRSEVTSSLISLESLSSEKFNETVSISKEIEQQLMATPYFGKMLSKMPTEMREVAIEAAVVTMMCKGDPAAYHQSAREPVADVNVKLVNPNNGYNAYRNDYTLEGFEPHSPNQFLAQSVYVNAMVAVQGGYEEAFFPIQIIPATTNGVDVAVSVPKVYQAGSRDTAGSKYNISKTNIIKALVDSSVLENDTTKIVPRATNDTTPATLVQSGAGQWANTAVVIGGETVNTRAILTNTPDVDIIGLSNTTVIGTQDETDVLDPTVNVGKLFTALSLNDGSITRVARFGFDVSSQPGSLLQAAAQDSKHAYLTTFTASVVLAPGYSEAGYFASVGAKETFESDVEGILSGGSLSKIIIRAQVTARANIEYGNMDVSVANITIEYYDLDGVQVAMPGGWTVSATIPGFYPAARKTNSNFRTRGTIIDSTTVVNYRFPVPLQSPFISQQAVGAQVNTSVEGLAHAERIRNNNNAVKALLGIEELLKAGNGLPVNSPTLATELYINPTYVAKELDLDQVVVRMASKDSMDDLRGAFQIAIQTVVDQMLQDSNYLAALEFTTGNNNDYEVIVVTDSRIYPWIMESGDSRTLGSNRKFKITQSLNESIKDKIYISLRRSTRDGQISPMDFGCFLYTPALTHTVQVSRNNRINTEIHTIPRNAYYVTLPILGRVDVLNMVELFVDP